MLFDLLRPRSRISGNLNFALQAQRQRRCALIGSTAVAVVGLIGCIARGLLKAPEKD
jgi:hypothetical protein